MILRTWEGFKTEMKEKQNIYYLAELVKIASPAFVSKEIQLMGL